MLLSIGCRQKMAEQPSYRELQPCESFDDGRSERPEVPGTVARGHLQTDVALFTGRRAGKNGEPLGMRTPAVVQPPPGSPAEAEARKHQYDAFVDEYPFPMSKQVLEHGDHRYMIYCVVCHDPLGTGKGKIVERGYTAPPSLHTERLRAVPPGYLFAVISEGYGSMPSYSAQIPVRDRWAIAGFLRALQASQHFPAVENSPLPLGEGPGVRAIGGTAQQSAHILPPQSPHTSPLPKGEGTKRAAAMGAKSP